MLLRARQRTLRLLKGRIRVWPCSNSSYGPLKPLFTTRSICDFPQRDLVVSKFQFPLATHTIQQVFEDAESLAASKTTVVLNGHLHKKPRHLAARIFAELRDCSGLVCHLLLDPSSAPPNAFESLKQSMPEECACVTGYIKRKVQSPLGPGAAQWELVVLEYLVLNSSTLDASRLDKLKHADPANLPPQFRYLQLRTAPFQRALRARSHASQVVRQVLVSQHGFCEIETPLLFKSTPEGAREFLVPTRTPAKFYALPQSPQQYKQMLMLSGFTRYFQLAKCFRDEDLRADRQPEFTQVDLEMAYVNNSAQVRHVVEDVVQSIWKTVGNMQMYTLNDAGLLVEAPASGQSALAFSSLTYRDALARFGIDKPDLRSALENTNLTRFFSPLNHVDFPVVEACILRNAFSPGPLCSDASKNGPKNLIVPKRLRDKSLYPSRAPIIVPITNESLAKLWYEEYLGKVIEKNKDFDGNILMETLRLKPGDIIAFSQRAHLSYENPTPLGKFRLLAIEQYPGKWQRPFETGNPSSRSASFSPPRDRLFVGAWVIEFPLFSPVETGSINGYPQYGEMLELTHHPFTMAMPEDYDSLQTCPRAVRGEHYDLVVNGVEVGGGLRRVHDASLQRYIFERILRVPDYHDLFGHLLLALEMGCPPHAGLALGFDRLCAMLIGLALIRDVIAFPKTSAGIDPVVNSPSLPNAAALREYNIDVIGAKDS